MITERPIWSNLSKRLQSNFKRFQISLDFGPGDVKYHGIKYDTNLQDTVFAYAWMKDISRFDDLNRRWEGLFRQIEESYKLPARCPMQCGSLRSDVVIDGIIAKTKDIQYINSHSPVGERVKVLQREGTLPPEYGAYSLGTVATIKSQSGLDEIQHDIAFTAAEDTPTTIRRILHQGNCGPGSIELIISKEAEKDTSNIIRKVDGDVCEAFGRHIDRPAPRIVDALPDDLPYMLVGLGGAKTIHQHYLVGWK